MTHAPLQEPLSPELDQAVLRDRAPVPATNNHTSPAEPQTVTNTVSHNVTTTVSSSQGESQEGARAGVSATSSGPRKFSLFEGVVSSKRTKRNTVQPSTSVTTSGPSGEGGSTSTGRDGMSSFEALSEIVDSSPEQLTPQQDSSSPHTNTHSLTTLAGEGGGNTGTDGMSSFEALSEIIDSSPEQLTPRNVSSSPHTSTDNLTALAAPTSETDLPAKTESQDKFFEELATAGHDFSLPFTGPQSPPISRCNTGLTLSHDKDNNDGISVSEMRKMDWEDTTHDEEFYEDMEEELGSFSSPESNSHLRKEIATGDKDNREPEASIGKQTSIGIAEASLLERLTVKGLSTSDSDWEMLGEMSDEEETNTHSMALLGPVKQHLVAREPRSLNQTPLATSSVACSAATVPDIVATAQDFSYTADIEEYDFNWD